MQRIVTSSVFRHNQGIYITPLSHRTRGSFISEEVTEIEKSQRSGRDRSRTVSSGCDVRAASLVTSEQLCGCLHKASSSSSQLTLQFGVGRHSRISTQVEELLTVDSCQRWKNQSSLTLWLLAILQ